MLTIQAMINSSVQSIYIVGQITTILDFQYANVCPARFNYATELY